MGAFDLGFDVLPRFAGRMRGWVWGGYHLDIGTHEALERGRQDIGSVFPDSATTRTGAPQPAIFLDRDGTIIEHVHYLNDPDRVRLIAGAAEALRRFRAAGFARVVVTNQSAIARGMLTVQGLHEIHAEMNRQLAAAGATVDAIYYCADAPIGDDRTTVENQDRKPGPGMLLRAAADWNLDLASSWMIGDLVSDALAGVNAGCRSILLETDQMTTDEKQAVAGRFPMVHDLPAAANLILGSKENPR
jgi:D-glycero-D-manno-heptose 1,7-bisphosphate phosphatase